MHLNNQICTLEQANRFKELGLDQEDAQYYWSRPINAQRDFTSETMEANQAERNWTYEHDTTESIKGSVAAYTCADIGEMLTGLEEIPSTYYSNHGVWQWQMLDPHTLPAPRVSHHDNGEYATEAEARAAMLLYAIEKELITVEYCNEVLKLNADPYEDR